MKRIKKDYGYMHKFPSYGMNYVVPGSRDAKREEIDKDKETLAKKEKTLAELEKEMKKCPSSDTAQAIERIKVKIWEIQDRITREEGRLR